MPNLSAVLKSEIARIARKEIRSAVDPLRKANAQYRRDIAELKRQLVQVQKQSRAAATPSRSDAATPAANDAARMARFSAKGLKSLRARLGLSAVDFGRLVGASGQSIYNWESGKARPRAAHHAALGALRSMGKREAIERLDGLG